MRRVLLLSSLLLVACNSDEDPTHQHQDVPMNPITEAKQTLNFTCKHETIPEPSAEAEVLFQYARWLQKNNVLKSEMAVDIEVERLYRIAAENDHYKANINLQNGAMRGRFKLNDEEHLRLSQRLIDAQVASGYYFIGLFLKNGSAGLKQDPGMSLRYFRKAADEGSAAAQASVASKLAPRDVAPNVARQLRRCAAEQGHARAAVMLSIYLQDEKKYEEAMEVLQMAVMAGDEFAAGRLKKVFRGPPPSDEMYYLGQQENLERAERYEKIWRILANYSYADPKVPEINQILPLPPAKLPAWDGKLQWLEARLANIPPEKPSEALIHQLANAKRLDPATGKGLPGSPAFTQAHLSSPNCYSGQACPVSGYWQVGRLPLDYSVKDSDNTRYFKKGEVFPVVRLKRHQYRSWPFSDKVTHREQAVEWRLHP
jgi:TPR repeat protein/uncharacterized protein YcfL